jgi:hypothetical protein
LTIGGADFRGEICQGARTARARNDPGAFLREPYRGRFADSLAGTGHESDLAFHPARHI